MTFCLFEHLFGSGYFFCNGSDYTGFFRFWVFVSFGPGYDCKWLKFNFFNFKFRFFGIYGIFLKIRNDKKINFHFNLHKIFKYLQIIIPTFSTLFSSDSWAHLQLAV